MNSKKKTFDELWQKQTTVGLGCRCPLKEGELEAMVQKAILSTPMAEEKPAAVRRPFANRLIAPLGIAAAVALILIPINRKSYAASIPTVKYGDQSIRFVCNHECAPDGVIGSFNSFVDSL